jgi:phage shock protein A
MSDDTRVAELEQLLERSEQALTVARTELAQVKAKWAHTAERIVESYARLTEKLFDQRLRDISDGTAPKTQDGGR